MYNVCLYLTCITIAIADSLRERHTLLQATRECIIHSVKKKKKTSKTLHYIQFDREFRDVVAMTMHPKSSF